MIPLRAAIDYYLEEEGYAISAAYVEGQIYSEETFSSDLVLPMDTLVYDICCVRGEGSSMALVGYITNAGDFILYGNMLTGNIYLIPLETYHMIGSQMTDYHDLPEDVWNLEPYRVQMPSN